MKRLGTVGRRGYILSSTVWLCSCVAVSFDRSTVSLPASIALQQPRPSFFVLTRILFQVFVLFLVVPIPLAATLLRLRKEHDVCPTRVDASTCPDRGRL